MALSEIILPEHNSSRLLFINDGILNSSQAELIIEDTTTDANCDCDGDIVFSNKWLLGRLNSNIWLLEDCGVYDSNHEHTAKIYYINPDTNQEVFICNVRRVMEYGLECDRLYCQTGGGMKTIFTDGNIDFENLPSVNFYIKYEKNLPPIKEEVSFEEDDHGTKTYSLTFYKKNELNQIGITDVLSITNNLQVQNINNLHIIIPSITDLSADFSKISIKYNIGPNPENDLQVGIIGVNTANKKFISPLISNGCIEPTYFMVVYPKNRSWICYRISTDIVYGVAYNNRKVNGYNAVLINRADEGLTGSFGISQYSNTIYSHNINLDRSHERCFFMLPLQFTDYEEIRFQNSSRRTIDYDGESIIEIYNELDGMYYRVYTFLQSSEIYSMQIRYRIPQDN